MKNPYVLKQTSYFTNKTDRALKKIIYDNLLKLNKDSDCIYNDIINVSNFNNLNLLIGKLDLNLILNQIVSKLSSFSPVNFNDFIKMIDETYILLSCLWSETASKIDNNSTPDKPFNLGLILEELFLDFFNQFRKTIIADIQGVIFAVIKRFFIDILNYIDCNKINKCIVPCTQDRNPYKSMFGQVLIKGGQETLIYLKNQTRNLKSLSEIDVDENSLKDYYNRVIKNLTPNEIECLLNGLINSKVMQFLIDLFETLFGKKPDEVEIINIFDNFKNIVDISFGSSNLAPINPCGNLSLEAFTRLTLKNEGKTEEEINTAIDIILSENLEQLTYMSTILNGLSFNINISENIDNADITKTILNASINSLFLTLEQTQKIRQNILKNILLSPTGELIIAIYKIYNSQMDEINFPSSIQNILNEQIQPIQNNSSLWNFNNPMSYFSDIGSNFYTKYIKNSENVYPPISIKYLNNNQINVYSDNILLFAFNKFSIADLINQISIPNEIPEITDYIGLTNRGDVSELFTDNNILLKDYYNIDLETNYIYFYNKFVDLISENLIKSFYFQEYLTSNFSNQNKKDFINLDLLMIEKEKTELKIKLNIND